MAAEFSFIIVALGMAVLLAGSFLLFKSRTTEGPEILTGGSLSKFHECYDPCIQDPKKAAGDCVTTCAYNANASRTA